MGLFINSIGGDGIKPTPGERRFGERLRTLLEDDYLCWHNVPIGPLRQHPDFVVLSFYKIFGYPTGVGALLARPRALGKLRRPWFAGGTITVASVGADRYYLASGSPAFAAVSVTGVPSWIS